MQQLKRMWGLLGCEHCSISWFNLCGGYKGDYVVINLSFCDESIHVSQITFCVCIIQSFTHTLTRKDLKKIFF